MVVPHYPHSTTNETPFRLTFGTKTMISIEIGEPSPGPPSSNTHKMKTSYDSNKLTPNWEGRHRIVEDIGKGTY
ncbi:hypothetical protein CR513_31133, partial [Mucuna pruriens]